MASFYGRVSLMEHPAGCGDRPGVRERLTEAFRSLQSGSCPSPSAAEVAALILSGVCGLSAEGRECPSAGDCHDNCVELSYISLTLVEKITSSLMSHSLPPAATLHCEEILRVLLQQMDLMTQLVRGFQAKDKIISHLAAKSVSTCVFYQLFKSGTVSSVWEQKCVQAFRSSPPGTGLDACLWSLTDILKRLLKARHQEILGKLLASFDRSLSDLCSRFLPEERGGAMQHVMDFPSSRPWGTTFCLLLDLLEALTASSLISGAGVCLRCQRLTHIHSSALLTSISCSSEYFVRKRVLLLLKRVVLQKAGEDWALETLLSGIKYEHFNPDMKMLSQSVLAAVAANWLESVQVDSASFFGGTRHIQSDEGQTPDFVMLRAVSMLLLKSMELHIQTTSEAGEDRATELFGYLQSLWGFLSRYSVQLREVTHLCCWVHLLFGEQDDDMMAASNALLSIFLHHRLCSGLEDLAVLEAACASGINPHCHFLLLLQSISFDHSILLDFLISSETCFLEYFVRYLKFLRADWQGFTAACERISESDLSLQKSTAASCCDHTPPLTFNGVPDQVEFSSCVQPSGVISPAVAGLRLVEYGSSDESEPENMDCYDEADTSASEKSRCSDLDVKQEMSGPPIPIRQKQRESSHSPNSALENKPGGSALLLLQSERASFPKTGPLSGQQTCEQSARSVLCLSGLREVVTRLHTKKLFPYNPSSLLKLLTQVLQCSQQSHPSHFNK